MSRLRLVLGLGLRRGVAYDDQKTLLIAEVRHMTGAARRGLLHVRVEAGLSLSQPEHEHEPEHEPEPG